LTDVTYCDGPYSCAEGANVLVIVTEWEQFRALDLPRLKREMECPVMVDLRNIYRAEEVTAHGFRYESVGRGARGVAQSLANTQQAGGASMRHAPRPATMASASRR